MNGLYSLGMPLIRGSGSGVVYCTRLGGKAGGREGVREGRKEGRRERWEVGRE